MKRLMTLAVAALVAGGAWADTWTDPDTGITWTYTLSNGKASLGGGSDTSPAVPTSTAGVLSIPPALDGYLVASIGSYAFYNCTNLVNVTIPNGVTEIRGQAFYKCANLENVMIPKEVLQETFESYLALPVPRKKGAPKQTNRKLLSEEW